MSLYVACTHCGALFRESDDIINCKTSNYPVHRECENHLGWGLSADVTFVQGGYEDEEDKDYFANNI